MRFLEKVHTVLFERGGVIFVTWNISTVLADNTKPQFVIRFFFFFWPGCQTLNAPETFRCRMP